MADSIMRLSEVIEDLNHLNIHINDKEFKKIDQGLSKLIYNSLFEIILEIDLKEFADHFQLPPAIDANFDFPELHEQSVPIALVNWFMCSLLSDIGVEEFSLADILHPTEKQTRRILSVLIPYCYFAIQQRQYREEIYEELNDFKQESRALQDEIEGIELAIEDEAKAKQEQDAEEQKLAQQLEMTKERAVALYAEQDALYHTLEEKKQIFTQLRMDIEKIQQATKEEEETCQSLQERIIPSPDRLIRDRDAKLQDLANEQSLLDNYEREYQQYVTKLGALDDCIDNVQGVQEMLKDVDAKSKEIKAAKSKVKCIQNSIMALEDELRRLSTTEQGLQNQSRNVEGKIKTLQKKKDMMRQSESLKIQNIHEEREQYKQLLQRALQDKENADEECDVWQKKIEQLSQRHQEEVAAARQELDILHKEPSGSVSQPDIEHMDNFDLPSSPSVRHLEEEEQEEQEEEQEEEEQEQEEEEQEQEQEQEEEEQEQEQKQKDQEQEEQ
eukprot:gene9527-1761_t